jgi:phosphoribosylaminoimidazole-succinocarboxamide synthase
MQSAARPALFESTIKSLPLLGRGKVRDIYAVGDDHLLIVTTDRLSAFDVILPDPIPGKGEILTAMSLFWFRHFEDMVPHHLGTCLGSLVERGWGGAWERIERFSISPIGATPEHPP